MRVAEKGTGLAYGLRHRHAREALGHPRSPRQGRPAIPFWVKKGVDAWQEAGAIKDGPLLRSISKGAKVGESLSDWAIWAVVTESAKQIGIERFGAHDLRRTCAKLCHKAGGDLEQIKFLLGPSSIQTTEHYLGSEQDIAIAVNEGIGL